MMMSEDGVEEQELLLRASAERSSDFYSDRMSSEVHFLHDTLISEKLNAANLPRWMSPWYSRRQRSRSRIRRMARFAVCLLGSTITLALVIAFISPSYSKAPPHYDDLKRRIRSSDAPGRANIRNEKIFIASALLDKNGELLTGAWAKPLRDLIHILGPQNVYLSIYENNADNIAEGSLAEFGETLSCNHSLVSESLDYAGLPHVTTQDGTPRLKRITYLAEVRNRALAPLRHPNSSASAIKFDKLLFLNDVVFEPMDAANLILSTNQDTTTGITDYRAACAVDFINPFKFYDTFATRDLEGFEMGVPFFPWFTAAGHGQSRRDVLEQRDAVRVKSCWGGMVSFEAKWFQPHMHPDLRQHNAELGDIDGGAMTPLRFRAVNETYWESSECCLIHADLMHLATTSADADGIYMNPYVRVAYSSRVLRWLAFTRRFERLYPLVHHLVNLIANRPGTNPRRLDSPGTEVVNTVWTRDDAALHAIQRNDVKRGWMPTQRIASPGHFCGFRSLMYINEAENAQQDRKWAFDSVRVP